jgi:hypothetical protein
MSKRCLEAHLLTTYSIPIENIYKSTLQMLQSYLLRSRMFRGRIFLSTSKCCSSVSKVRLLVNKLKPNGWHSVKTIWKRLFCCHSSDETSSYWDTDTTIMLIHAFVALKINNRNFCFLNGLELPAVCYFQLILSKAVHDLVCSQRRKGIFLCSFGS